MARSGLNALDVVRVDVRGAVGVCGPRVREVAGLDRLTPFA